MLAAIPPPPKAVAFAFELWVVLDGVDTKVAEVSTRADLMATMCTAYTLDVVLYVPEPRISVVYKSVPCVVMSGTLRYHRASSIAKIHCYALIDARGDG